MKLLSGIVLLNVLRYVFVQLFCLALFYLQNCAHTHTWLVFLWLVLAEHAGIQCHVSRASKSTRTSIISNLQSSVPFSVKPPCLLPTCLFMHHPFQREPEDTTLQLGDCLNDLHVLCSCLLQILRIPCLYVLHLLGAM